MSTWPDDDVILYDGVCVFCSRWIRFIAARDKDRRFRFTAIQSGLWHTSRTGVRHRPERPRHQCRHPWRHRQFQIRRGADGAEPSAGLGLGAGVVCGAKAAPRRRLQSRRAQPLPDIREVSGMLCAGCGVQGQGDGVGRCGEACVRPGRQPANRPSTRMQFKVTFRFSAIGGYSCPKLLLQTRLRFRLTKLFRKIQD